MPERTYRLIVHGGAWDIPPSKQRAHRDGCVNALLAGEAILDRGGSSIEAVEAAVTLLEDDPTFDPGRGSFLNVAGEVQLDAGLMDGRTLDVGAVAALSRVRNPISVARALLRTDHVLLVGDGADAFAESQGLAPCEADWLTTPEMRELWAASQGREASAAEFFAAPRGTVGAVALDRNGDIAAATSTGGAPGKPVGRVGDSPVPGAGYYADNLLAGVSATGWGEAFLRLVVCYRAAAATAHVPAQPACAQMIEELARLNARGGLIMVDRGGAIGCAFNTTAMAFAYRDRDGRILSGPG